MLSLVTGGAGFVGSHLVDALLLRGDDVIIVDNLSTGNVRNIGAATESGRATFVYLDVAQTTDALRAALEPALAGRRISRLFHLASPASPDAYGSHPWETLAVNGLGTMSLIDIALEHGARFLFTSTSEVYGDPLVHPQPETYFGNVDPIGLRACYDEGKRFAEAAVSVAIRSRGLDGRLTRFFNCYGAAHVACGRPFDTGSRRSCSSRASVPDSRNGLADAFDDLHRGCDRSLDARRRDAASDVATGKHRE